MKTSLFDFRLVATKVYRPELDKGERNPYTTGNEAGNPFMKDKEIKIDEIHVQEVLELLQKKGYNISDMS